jgi:hypothetical protein
MREMEVNPREVWSFYRFKGIPWKLTVRVYEKGWEGILRVPVYEIPQEYRRAHYKYLLIDGAHRKKTARFLNKSLPAIIFEPGEEIKPDEQGLAPFKHSSDKDLYQKILTFYVNYKEIIKDLASREKKKN